jgi:hypothetical protein
MHTCNGRIHKNIRLARRRTSSNSPGANNNKTISDITSYRRRRRANTEAKKESPLICGDLNCGGSSQ